MDNTRKRKRSASAMAASNKLSRTSNSLSTDVKVELTKHASKKIKSTQKINYSNLDVDLILDHKVFKNKMFYLVKPKNRTIEYSEWEPEEKLMDSASANVLYYQQVIVNSLETLNEDMISFFVKDLVSRQPQDILTLTKLCAVIYGFSEEMIGSLRLTFAQLTAKALKVLDIPVKRLNKEKKYLCHLMRFSEARKRVLNVCAEWEQKINRVSPVYVRVENDVDLELPPANFRYINDYESSYVDLTPRPEVCCNCDDCFKEHTSCCAQLLKDSIAYDDQGREPQGFEIYECNSLCKCGPDCPNRVVQRGPVIELCIFRTSNGCGWGLKTLEEIKRGQFVLEYPGEVITEMDADVRDEAYDWTGTTYLFDLGPNKMFTVDAGSAGNASHFINHSCNPNLQVYTVWGEQQDPGLPRLAFFSRRKIAEGEQLTFDYKMQGDADYIQAEGDRVRCMCGSKNCRKYLF